MNTLEHVNVTVANPLHTAEIFCKLFDWSIRWSGKALNGGNTVHVGQPENGASYLALYTPAASATDIDRHSSQSGNLNHIAVVVNDLEQIEQRARDLGLKPINHGDYEPGRRFYLLFGDELEVEVVSYQA